MSDVRALTRMRERGGRIRWIGPNEAMVLDVMEWSDSLSHALKEKHPFLLMCFESAPDSLSGFGVRLKLDPTEEICRRVGIACVVIAILSAVTAYCLDLFSRRPFYIPMP